MTRSGRNDLDRRTFIRKAAATGAISLGAAGATAGSAAASTAPVSPDRADLLLALHGADVLAMLEADGVLADRSDLPTAIRNDLAAVVRGREGTAMLSMPGRPDELRVVKRVEEGTLTVAVRPGDGGAFAVLATDEGTIGYDLDRGRFDFTAQSSCRCTGEPCGPYPDVGYIRECCYGSSCTYECECF